MVISLHSERLQAFLSNDGFLDVFKVLQPQNCVNELNNIFFITRTLFMETALFQNTKFYLVFLLIKALSEVYLYV